jgi:hypothetical protein
LRIMFKHSYKEHFMKYINYICKTILLFLVGVVTLVQIASAQDSEKESAVKSLIESGNFVFEAQTALPIRAQVRQLTFGFDMRVSKDTINSYLPYFGRAYVAPVNPTEGALNFVSTDFDYTVKNRRKGGWDILIVTKDQRDNKRMLLTVQESGHASLQVTSTNRQPISFNGFVLEKRK